MPRRSPGTLDDPIAFALDLWGSIGATEPELCDLAPAEYAAFCQAIRAAEGLISADADPALRRAVEEVGERAHDWGHLAHSAGVSIGVAAEQLRRTLIAAAD